MLAQCNSMAVWILRYVFYKLMIHSIVHKDHYMPPSTMIITLHHKLHV